MPWGGGSVSAGRSAESGAFRAVLGAEGEGGRRRKIALRRARRHFAPGFVFPIFLFIASGGGARARLVAGQAQRLLFAAAAFSERPLLVAAVGWGCHAPCLFAAAA